MLEKTFLDVGSSSDFIGSAPKLHKKKVTFAREDEIAYMYPWSPTKYLLFGQYTEEQLKERQKYHSEFDHLVSILKKQSPEGIVKDSGDQENSFVPPINTLLEEVHVDDISPMMTMPRPSLPSMMIFSPSEEKESITNNLRDEETALTVPIKAVKRRKKKKKLINGSFTLFGQSLNKKDNEKAESNIMTSSNSTLPRLATSVPSPSEGSTQPSRLPRKHTRMPSIENNYVDSIHYNFKTPEVLRKPLIHTQISQRYTLNESDFSNIQNLNEEDFSESRTSKKMRQPLPSIKPVNYKKTRQKTVKVNDNKRKKKTTNRKSRKETSGSLLRSCSQQANSANVHGNNNVIQLQQPQN